MSNWTFILRNLRQHWRIHFAVMLGVAAATAVLTGALLVGDSMRSSLRDLTLQRLGRIDELLIADRFFRRELVQELQATAAFKADYSAAAPMILFPGGAVEHQTDDGVRRASQIVVIGCDEQFWKLGSLPTPALFQPPTDGAEIDEQQIVLNAPLAEELGITPAAVASAEGATVTLRFPRLEQVPSENPLGKKEDLTQSLPRLKVAAIIPAESIGRFSLHPAQIAPKNAYLLLPPLQGVLRQKDWDDDDRINAIAVAGKSPDAPPDAKASAALRAALKPTLSDYGFLLTHARQEFTPAEEGAAPEEVFDYFSFTSERMLLSEEAEQAAQQAFSAEHAQPVLTYLANAIALQPQDPLPDGKLLADDVGVPYSTVSAVDWSPAFHPLDLEGQPLPDLADDQIVLNSLTAQDLGAKVGDKIRVLYFKPETTHGETDEQYADFRLAAITPLTEPVKPYGRRRPPVFKERPTLANDPDLTPYVPGVTDTESIEDWDLPFAMTRPIRGQDDQYWSNHRTTPKAFISLAAGRRLWASRFGETTSLRIPAGPDVTEEKLADQFLQQVERDDLDLGLAFLPIKRRQLEASVGSTPFDGLFLALSMFIIAAALLLVMLLFRLGIEQRASEIGLLQAIGFRRRKTALLLAGESLLVALAGGVIGVAIGVAYGELMIYGLTTWWVGAVGSPFLKPYIKPQTLAIGLLSGAGVSLLTILFTLWRTRKTPTRQLLSGQASASPGARRHRSSMIAWAAVAFLFLAALCLSLLATQLSGEAQAGAFLGSGAAVLGLLLLFVWIRLRGSSGSVPDLNQVNMHAGSLSLAMRSLQRNPSRSLMTIALVAAASFLIVAVSSFHMEPTEEGVGGFSLIGQTISPVFVNLNDPAARKDLLGSDSILLDGGAVLSLRLMSGDDASCSNLYKASSPRVLGVPPDFVRYFDQPETPHFGFAGSAVDKEHADNPWYALQLPALAEGETMAEWGRTRPIPVILDKNTAVYSLQLMGGIGQEFTLEYPDLGPIKFQVSGLLANSILQGSLLMDEQVFKQLFPEEGGYRYFLIRTRQGDDAKVASALEDRLSDQGFDAVSSEAVLSSLLAVQNTYISTFQALGSLGLLLGVFGLAAAQLRSVLERRGELALLRAVGFRKRSLGQMVMLENMTLFFEGLGCGVLAALAAVAPHVIFGGATVPVLFLGVMLLLIAGLGALVGLFAVRATLQAPLLAALRGD
ncbi:ABC transporter permease [Lignipirellula cremea]|uniref:FtsX-like permease family protein n=1 Tax=Lignipirellula cremea TaxID=2528010 RepID=A0A518DTF1_9BACT|nr:ABC transporter permease [Lignipirellula cremea]QDU95119.1 FtsX-like permease family protein [Lignipirellula cremea]